MSTTGATTMRPFRHDLQSVDTVSPDEHDLLRQRMANHQPFLAKGLINSWPLVQQVREAGDPAGQIEIFGPLLGDEQIRYTYTPATQHGDIGIGPDLQSNFSLADRTEPGLAFLDGLGRLVRQPTGECMYAASLPLSGLPNLAAGLAPLDFICDTKPRQRNLWIGSGDHVVDLHFDDMRNLLSMVAGVKRVTILPPEALPYIYPAPLHRPVAGVTRSLVKLLEVDFDEYPRFERALELAQVTIVEPGDTLHIPPLWWHHVESYGFNVMVNAWYNDTPQSSVASFERAHKLFRKSIIPFSKLDDDGAAKIANYMDVAVFADKVPDTLVTERPPWRIRRALAGVRDSLLSLDSYWRDYLQLQYEYYCLRKYGDPYPTMPGMLQQVAAAMKMKIGRGIRRRVLKLLGRPAVRNG